MVPGPPGVWLGSATMRSATARLAASATTPHTVWS